MTDLNEICSETKQARELSLTGQYQEALTYYESVLSRMRRHIGTVVERDRKQRWQQVATRTRSILFISSLCARFQEQCQLILVIPLIY